MKIVYQPNYVGLPWKSIPKGVRNGMSSFRGNAGEDLSAARRLCALSQYSPGIFQGWGRQKKIIDPSGTGDWDGHEGDAQEILRSAETQNVDIWKTSPSQVRCVSLWIRAGWKSGPYLNQKKTQLLWFHSCFEELISDLWFFPALSLRPLKRFDICRKKDKNMASVLLSLPAVHNSHAESKLLLESFPGLILHSLQFSRRL